MKWSAMVPARKMNRRLGAAMRCAKDPGWGIATAGKRANRLGPEILVSDGEKHLRAWFEAKEAHSPVRIDKKIFIR